MVGGREGGRLSRGAGNGSEALGGAWESRIKVERGIAGSRRTVYVETLLSASCRPFPAHRRECRMRMSVVAMMI